MATNKTAIFQITMNEEGGYTGNDLGSRAYIGINEKANPDWAGWSIVTKYVTSYGGNKKAYNKKFNDPQLTQLVYQKYEDYWNKVGKGLLNIVNDTGLAAHMFDHGFNSGQIQSTFKTCFGVDYNQSGINSVNLDPSATQKFIEARNRFYESCWKTKVQKGEMTEEYRQKLIASAKRRVERVTKAASSPTFPKETYISDNTNNIKIVGLVEAADNIFLTNTEYCKVCVN